MTDEKTQEKCRNRNQWTSFNDYRKGNERSICKPRRVGTRPGISSALTNFIRATLSKSASRTRRIMKIKPNNHGPPKVYINSSRAV